MQKKKPLPVVYARIEPTRDEATRKAWPDTKKRDVVIYEDLACTKVFASYPWYLSTKPAKENKTITLACVNWRVKWLRDVACGNGAAL